MFLPEDRAGFRRMFARAWHKRREGLPADPLEIQDADWTPEGGQTNPFLHMALHLAIREQVSTDRPPGIAAEHARLAARHGVHEAEHLMLEALGEALWRAQRNNSPPDEVSYLESLKRLGA